MSRGLNRLEWAAAGQSATQAEHWKQAMTVRTSSTCGSPLKKSRLALDISFFLQV
jgi:hypothetical protein